MKKGIMMICLLLAALLLTGCGEQKKDEQSAAETQAAGTGKTAAEGTRADETGNTAAADRQAATLAEKVRSAAQDADTLIPLTEEDLSDDLGIEAGDYDEFVFLTSSGMDGREILVVRAKNGEAAGKIAEKMENYLGRRRDEARNYAPEAYELLNAASVKTCGRTAALVVGKDADRETGIILAGE